MTTKRQLADQELVRETVLATLTAGASILAKTFHFSDTQQTAWILKTAALMAEHIGTEQAQVEIAEAYDELLRPKQG